jgi:hypothetical protein
LIPPQQTQRILKIVGMSDAKGSLGNYPVGINPTNQTTIIGKFVEDLIIQIFYVNLLNQISSKTFKSMCNG